MTTPIVFSMKLFMLKIFPVGKATREEPVTFSARNRFRVILFCDDKDPEISTPSFPLTKAFPETKLWEPSVTSTPERSWDNGLLLET